MTRLEVHWKLSTAHRLRNTARGFAGPPSLAMSILCHNVVLKISSYILVNPLNITFDTFLSFVLIYSFQQFFLHLTIMQHNFYLLVSILKLVVEGIFSIQQDPSNWIKKKCHEVWVVVLKASKLTYTLKFLKKMYLNRSNKKAISSSDMA